MGNSEKFELLSGDACTYSITTFDGISRGTCLRSVHLTLTLEEPNLTQVQFFGQALSHATTSIRTKMSFFKQYIPPSAERTINVQES